MVLQPKKLVGLRDELSLLIYKAKCFAILWGPELNAEDIGQFVQTINKFNLLRVSLHVSSVYQDYTAAPFMVVEMTYQNTLHQSYFTSVMWEFSHRWDLWIHVWDTFEHDALRRDFKVPESMDSELCINRLWLHKGSVVFINKGHTRDNPHGEFVPELPLQAAMDCIAASEYILVDTLTEQIARSSEDVPALIVENTTDYGHVYIPKALASFVLEHPSLISHFDHEIHDATNLVLESIPSDLLLCDEVPFTVAVPDRPIGDSKNSNRPSLNNYSESQWISIAIKVNVNLAFAKGRAEEATRSHSMLGEKLSEDSFSSSYLITQLEQLGFMNYRHSVKFVESTSGPLAADWTKPVCLVERSSFENPLEAMTAPGELKYTEQKEGDEGKQTDVAQSSNHSSDEEKTIFTGLEDTSDFVKNFKALISKMEGAGLSEASQAFVEKDLQFTEHLDDFDDFVEFYARRYMGYTDDDLEKHRISGQDLQDVQDSDSTSKTFDWAKYNNDSDYESG